MQLHFTQLHAPMQFALPLPLYEFWISRNSHTTTGKNPKGLSIVIKYNQVYSHTLPEGHAERLLVADFYNGASCYPALNIVIEKIGNFLKIHGAPGNDIQCCRLEVSSQPCPDFLSEGNWAIG